MNRFKILLTLLPLCLTSCSSSPKPIDDVDLSYYVHHIQHDVYKTSKKAFVTIKQLKKSEETTYEFDELIWGDEYYFTFAVDPINYQNDGEPLNYAFTENSILAEHISNGFIGNLFWDCISVKEYYQEDENRFEESTFLGRIATISNKTLTLITQWSVISYKSKTPIESDGDDEEFYGYNYEEPNGVFCISKATYTKEKLDSYKLILSRQLYFDDKDSDGFVDYHEEVFDSPIDYLEYKVNFR